MANKADKKRKLRFHLGLRYLGSVLVYTLVYFLLVFVLMYFFKGLGAETLYAFCQRYGFWELYKSWYLESYAVHRELYVLLTYILGLVVVGVVSARRSTRYLREISNSLDNLLVENVPIGPFPGAIRDMELSLKETRYTLLRSQQLAHEAEQRKDDLVVYLAHDLKTPLASIIGYLTLLEESPDLPVAARAKYTSITLDKAYRLEQLINELFDITRYNMQNVVLERNLVNLTRMLQQMTDEFYPIFAEKGLHAQTDIAPGLSIIADSDKLARVFDNLLRNAVAYSYEGTAVTITAYAEEDTAVVKVRNTGDEIPPEKLANIFDKFFRADTARSSRSGGAGLGLAIARQIVEQHGGQITAQSSTEFTEFTVVMPKISLRGDEAAQEDKK